MTIPFESKAKIIFIKLGESNGEKHILQCLYLAHYNSKLVAYWDEVLNAFYILTKKQIADENR